MRLELNKEQARRFLLQKQLLTEQPKDGYAGIEYVFNKLRIVQYDPLNPCGRNPDLVLQARVDNYHPQDYYRWLYGERRGIECYDKALCIIPIEDYPLTAHNRNTMVEHPEVQQYFLENQKDFDELLEFIDQVGPVSTTDIVSDGKRAGKDWYGFGTRWGKFALELLWKTGQVVVVNRVNGNKYYDLPHKAYDKKYFQDDKHVEAEHMLRRIGSVGMMRTTGMTDAWRGVGDVRKKNNIVKQLINDGRLIEVSVQGIKTKYVIRAEDQVLLDTKPTLRVDVMRFIAPLDTLIWDRAMIEEFFGFRYRWEVYVPVAKREFGYYVLPILFKDQFVGRIEPVLQIDTLVIKNIWKEPGIKWTKQMDQRLDEAIERFRRYLRTEKILLKPNPSGLSP